MSRFQLKLVTQVKDVVRLQPLVKIERLPYKLEV